MADISKIILPDSSEYNLKDSISGYITGMTILSYGHSTWADFIAAYNANKVVYCRASSNTNPATGSQTRLAFMAYVNDGASPTNVEFQYYRSVNSHSATQQGDQVYVYKLDKTAGWTVTVRENYTKIVAGTGLGSSYSSGTLTLSSSISNATTSAAGLMSQSDKQTLDTISTNLGNHTVGTNVPSGAVFTDTTYSAGTGLELSGTTINHGNSITAGTAGKSSNTTGSNTLSVPYVTYNNTGHIISAGTHTHTISEATTTQSGVMSTADKQRLDSISGFYNAEIETIVFNI